MSAAEATEARPRSVFAQLAPQMAAVFVVYLVSGVALPALPLHVHQQLGLGAFAVGLVSSSQFAASLFSRVWAGAYSDTRGAKRAAILGLGMTAAAGALYFLSLAFVSMPILSATILIAGRATLGAGESFVIVAAQSWGLDLVGRQNAGKVMSWLGVALYGALAAGAPLGSALFADFGFSSIALATVLTPIAATALIAPMRPAPAKARVAVPWLMVAVSVSAPGAALALASVGFGVMTAFSVLLFVDRHWEPAWLAYTAFAVAFVAARVICGHLPDKMGGARVASIFAIIEAAGFVVIWASPWNWLGFVGTALVGFGYSLVYPGLGAEAVRRAPADARGLAIGVYTAYFDVALGLLLPSLGLLGWAAGLDSVFLASAILSLAAAPFAAKLARSATRVG